MKSAIVILTLFQLAPSLAMAQSAPCARGASSATTGGVDLDEMRCQFEIMSEQLGAAQATSAGWQAKAMLLQQDVKKDEADIAALKAKIAPAPTAPTSPPTP